MRKIAFLLVLLLCASWLPTRCSGASGTTVEGCLTSSSDHYFYYLTDSDGRRYHLSGSANSLKNYVDQQVKVTGTLSVRTIDTTQQGLESTAKEIAYLKVKSIRSAASGCKAAAENSNHSQSTSWGCTAAGETFSDAWLKVYYPRGVVRISSLGLKPGHFRVLADGLKAVPSKEIYMRKTLVLLVILLSACCVCWPRTTWARLPIARAQSKAVFRPPAATIT